VCVCGASMHVCCVCSVKQHSQVVWTSNILPWRVNQNVQVRHLVVLFEHDANLHLDSLLCFVCVPTAPIFVCLFASR